MAAGLSLPPTDAHGARRTLALIGLALAVLLLHGVLTEHLASRMADFGAAQRMPPRIEVAYVRELEAAAPPPATPTMPAPPPPAPVVRRAPLPHRAASAPRQELASATALAESAPEPPPEPLAAQSLTPTVVPELPAAPESEPVDAAAPVPEVAASAEPAQPAASAVDAAPPYEWPASTRLSYRLTGNYRGEVQGDAQVEWVHLGSRYQVHLDVTIGAAFAPIITRRMSSDGELGPQGLVPQRYDEDTKVIFRDRRRVSLNFGADGIVLADGRLRDRPPGVQDAASQFVQLSWLFSTRPQLLSPGATVEVPLALPRNVDRWVYDVQGEEALDTPIGRIQAFHLVPRRVSRPGGDLVAEIWYAPQWRYLPVRIRIRQDAETFIDLLIARKPELGAP